MLTTFWPICPVAFFRCFISNSGVHIESQTELSVWTTGVDCYNSVNDDQVQVLSHSKHFLIFLPVVGIEPATTRWFNLKTLYNQTPYPLHHVAKTHGAVDKVFGG